MNTRPAVLAAGWRTALAGGGVSFLAVAGAGQVLALGVGLLGGPPISEVPKLGWLYFCLFDHVPVRIEAAAPPAVLSTSASGTLTLALLGGTAGAAWLLFRWGRRVADEAGGGVGERLFHGAKVAPVYAIPALVVSLFVHAEIPVPSNPIVDQIMIRPSPVGAFAWPFAIALAAGAAGGYRSAMGSPPAGAPGSRAAGAFAGGWRMFIAGLALTFLGLLLLAALEPDATSAYARRMTADGPGPGAFLVANHLLALPNQSVWTLVAAMGGCDGVYGSGVSLDAICLDRVPRALTLDLFTPETGPDPSIVKAPRSFLVFLLVPAAATWLGGVHIASRLGPAGTGERAAVGACGGVVFAACMAVAAAMSGIRVSGDLFDGTAEGIVTYGPRALQAGVLALVWGIVGGAFGAILERRTSASSRS